MVTRTSHPPKPYDYDLLHLLTETEAGGRVVQHFVCFNCLELVESGAGIALHDCLMPTHDLGASGNSRVISTSPTIPIPELITR